MPKSSRKVQAFGFLLMLALSFCTCPAELLGQESQRTGKPGGLTSPVLPLRPGWISGLLLLLNLAGLCLLVLHVKRSFQGKGFFPSAPRNRTCWDWADLLVVGGFLFMTMYFFGMLGSCLATLRQNAVSPLGRLLRRTSPELMGLLPYPVTGLFVLRLVGSRSKLSALGLKRKNLTRMVGRGMLGYVLFLPLLTASTVVAFRLMEGLGFLPEQQEVTRLIIRAPSRYVLAILVVHAVVMAPIIEELVFRGFIQEYLCQRSTPAAGVLFTSLLFAVFHFNVFAGIEVFFLGLMLGYLYHRTQSLAAPVALHGLHNAIQLLMLLSLMSGGC